MGAQEVAHLCSQIPLVNCTHKAVSIHTDGSRAIDLDSLELGDNSDDPVTVATVLDLYMQRETLKGYQSAVMDDINLQSFVPKYEFKKYDENGTLKYEIKERSVRQKPSFPKFVPNHIRIAAITILNVVNY